MIYEREYWHYQKRMNSDHEPYAINLFRLIDTEDKPHIRLTAVFYCDSLDTHTRRLLIESNYRIFSIEEYALKIRKEVLERGVLLDDSEYYNLVTFIIDVLNDKRKVRESEILR